MDTIKTQNGAHCMARLSDATRAVILREFYASKTDPANIHTVRDWRFIAKRCGMRRDTTAETAAARMSELMAVPCYIIRADDSVTRVVIDADGKRRVSTARPRERKT